MDFQQLSPQIGPAPASGDLQPFAAGNSVGAASRERGFSSVLQAASQRVEARKDAKSRVAQSKTEDRTATTASEGQRVQSRRSDGSRGTKHRDSQSENDNRTTSTMSSVNRRLSHKASDGRESDHPPQSETPDQPSPTTSNISPTQVQGSSSGPDTDSHASQSETSEDTPLITSATDPLVISLAGTTVATPTSPVDPSKPIVASGTSTNDVDGPSSLSASTMIQPVTPSVEGVGKPIVSTNKLEDLANQHTTSAAEDLVTTVPLPTGEQTSDTAKIASDIGDAAQPDKGVSLTALQGQQIENVDPHQSVPIKDHQEQEVAPAPAPSAPVVVQGQEGAEQAVTAAKQSTLQHQEEVSAKSDQAPVQQMLGKGELSLQQKHLQVQTPASEAQAVATVSSHIQDEGQSLNSGSGSKGKDDGLKRLSHVDLQSAEMPYRTPEPSTVESGDGGHQYSSYQQGQGGTPPTIRPASAPSVPVPPQANQLSPDPEPTTVPRTQAVQFDMSPADFGQLRVRVVLSDHTIHTHLSTDRAELGQMLTGQQEQLSTQLTAAGLDMGRFQVQVDQERSRQSGQDGQSQAHSGTTPQQRDPRQQDRLPHDVPVPSQKRTGVLSLFA